MRDDSLTAADIVRRRIGGGDVDVGLVLGSGLAAIADHIVSPTAMAYEDLPGFPRPRVGGHEGALIVGKLGTARLAVFKGRTHHYETGDVEAMRVPLETLAALGAKAVVLTNAAGSANRDINPGSLVVIRDHINLTGLNPLVGESDDARFVDLCDAYDHLLRRRLAVAALDAGRRTIEGTYMWFPGPSFETPSEIRIARSLGADLVGMSTVPEVILARRLGLRVLAVSMVTNLAAGLAAERLSHEQTVRAAAASIVPLTRVLTRFFDGWSSAGQT